MCMLSGSLGNTNTYTQASSVFYIALHFTKLSFALCNLLPKAHHAMDLS